MGQFKWQLGNATAAVRETLLDALCPKVGTLHARVVVSYGLQLSTLGNHRQPTTFPFEVIPAPRS